MILPTRNIYAFRSTVGSTCKQVSLGVGLVHGSGDQQGTIAASAWAKMEIFTMEIQSYDVHYYIMYSILNHLSFIMCIYIYIYIYIQYINTNKEDLF